MTLIWTIHHFSNAQAHNDHPNVVFFLVEDKREVGLNVLLGIGNVPLYLER